MAKTTYKAASTVLPKDELVVAAKNFLHYEESNKDLIAIDNIHSPKFGSSDLLFVNEANTNLTVVRLNDTRNYEKFTISSISYYLWLKELITVGEAFFDAKRELEMYLFSHDFSGAIYYLMDSLVKEFRLYLVKYHILKVEDLDEPAIYFEHVTHEGLTEDTQGKKERLEKDVLSTKEKEILAAGKVSAQELSEFKRLTDLYLA